MKKEKQMNLMNGLVKEKEKEKEKITIDNDLKEILNEELEKEESDISFKKRRGRKKKIETLQIGQTLLIPINYLLNHFAEIYNEESFRLNEQESEEFGNAIDKVASKYLPLWIDKYSDELGLAFITFTIFYPRYNLYRNIKKKKLNLSEKEKSDNE